MILGACSDPSLDFHQFELIKAENEVLKQLKTDQDALQHILQPSTPSTVTEEDKKKAAAMIAEYKEIVARLQEQLETEEKRNFQALAKLDEQQKIIADLTAKNSALQKQGKNIPRTFQTLVSGWRSVCKTVGRLWTASDATEGRKCEFQRGNEKRDGN